MKELEEQLDLEKINVDELKKTADSRKEAIEVLQERLEEANNILEYRTQKSKSKSSVRSKDEDINSVNAKCVQTDITAHFFD